MLPNEILGKTQWICLDCFRFGRGKTGCVGLAYWIAQMYLRAEAGGQMVLDIAFPDVAHGGPSRPVACLKDARLERSLECRRREGKNNCYFKHTLAAACVRRLSSYLAKRFADGIGARSSIVRTLLIL